MMATTTNIVQSSIPILNEIIYDSLFIWIRTWLRSHDLWGFVTNGYPEPANEAVEMVLTNDKLMLSKDIKKKYNKFVGLIQQGLDDVIHSKFSNS